MASRCKLTLSDEEQEWLISNYPHLTNSECQLRLAVSLATLRRYRDKLQLTKSDEFMKEWQRKGVEAAWVANRRNGWPPKGYRIPCSGSFKKGETNLERLGAERNAARIAKAAATRRETLRKERLRVKWGLEQQTKLKVFHNRDRALYRYALKKRGYLVERGGREAFIVETTTRSLIVEERARKTGMRIIDRTQPL